ncbi:unnamed protein product [Auanema sp. JU1783]|nr:unnamed protein product [Auanema sp. JU1783]
MAENDKNYGEELASTSQEYKFSLDNAIEIFERMVLDCEKKVVPKSVEETKKNVSTQRSRSRSNQVKSPNAIFRWRPYSLPRRFSVTKSKSSTEDLSSVFSRVRWRDLDVDVDDLKYSLLERKDNISCSVQAARAPSPTFLVDELSEYFAHFVRVDLKMSALAESMYC